MTVVRLLRNWDWPDPYRQTPGGGGIWDGIRFTDEAVEDPDYVVVLNKPRLPTTVRCSPDRVWAIQQEPPIDGYRDDHRGPTSCSRVFMQDMSLASAKYVRSHGALVWHVDRDYDFLSRVDVPEKRGVLSTVTSNAKTARGHRMRLRFLDALQGTVDLDRYGRGFRPIADKWDAIAPYQYSLALEKVPHPYYWSEKLVDCFLSWTMPIYWGCPRITDYFPEESMVCIDIEDRHCDLQVRDAIESGRWRQNLEAIRHARDLVLSKYQLFPFVVAQIRQWEACQGVLAPHRATLTIAEPRPGLRYYRRRAVQKLLALFGSAGRGSG